MDYYAKRRIFILGIFFLLIAFIAYLVYLKFFKVYPTCNDGIQNQKEEGIDCGGPCKKICTFKAEKVNVDWIRAFEVTDGVYNIAGIFENPNFYYGYDVNYTIRYINDKRINIGEIKGKIYLKPLEKKVIFYPGINIKGQKISKVFVFKKNVSNLKQEEPDTNKIIVKNKEILEDKNGFTKLKVAIENTDIVPKNSIRITAVLYGEDGNVIDISRTYYESLDPKESAELYLTWRKKIEKKISEIKVYLETGQDEINVLE